MQEEIKTPQAGIDDAQVHAEIIRIEAISESKKGFVLSLIDILKTHTPEEMSTLKNNDKIPSHIKKIIDAFEKDPQLEDKIKAGKHPAILYEISSDALSSEFQENPEKAEALVINASAKMELLTLLGEEGYSTLEERVENIIRKIKVLNENQPLPPIFQGAEYMLLAHAVLRHKFPEYSEDVCRLLSQIYYSSSKLQRLENNPSEQ